MGPVVVVKLSACSPSTPMTLDEVYKFSVKFVVKKNENLTIKQKDAEDDPFKKLQESAFTFLSMIKII